MPDGVVGLGGCPLPVTLGAKAGARLRNGTGGRSRAVTAPRSRQRSAACPSYPHPSESPSTSNRACRHSSTEWVGERKLARLVLIRLWATQSDPHKRPNHLVAAGSSLQPGKTTSVANPFLRERSAMDRFRNRRPAVIPVINGGDAPPKVQPATVRERPQGRPDHR